MNFDAKIAVILSIIGTILWGLCLIAGLGTHNNELAYAFAMAAFSALLCALCVFWFEEEPCETKQ